MLDGDSDRGRWLEGEVEQLRPQEYDVMALDGAESLRRLVKQPCRGVLFLDARGLWRPTGAFSLASEAAAAGLQVVFVDGKPTAAYDVYAVAHVCLLPAHPCTADVERALHMAEARLDAMQARPLLVRTRGADRLLWPRRVLFAESDRRVLHIHTDAEVVNVYGKLADLMERLPRGFVQCHKSFVANMAMAESLEGDGLHLAGGVVVPVSQKRRAQVREALRAWVGREL